MRIAPETYAIVLSCGAAFVADLAGLLPLSYLCFGNALGWLVYLETYGTFGRARRAAVYVRIQAPFGARYPFISAALFESPGPVHPRLPFALALVAFSRRHSRRECAAVLDRLVDEGVLT